MYQFRLYIIEVAEDTDTHKDAGLQDEQQEAMQNFAKADELRLNEDAAGQMYHILGIVNQEFGKLDDALINLKKAGKIPGLAAGTYGFQGTVPRMVQAV